MVDIVLLRLAVRSGWPQRVMGLLIRVFALEQVVMQEGGVIGDAFRSWMNGQLEPILADEGMYTESVFLSREDGECTRSSGNRANGSAIGWNEG